MSRHDRERRIGGVPHILVGCLKCGRGFWTRRSPIGPLSCPTCQPAYKCGDCRERLGVAVCIEPQVPGIRLHREEDDDGQ